MKPKVKAKLLFAIRIPAPPRWMHGLGGKILVTIALWVLQVLGSFAFFANRDFWSGLIWAVSMWCCIMATRTLVKVANSIMEDGRAWHSMIEMVEEADAEEEFKTFLEATRDKAIERAKANGCKGEDCDGHHEAHP